MIEMFIDVLVVYSRELEQYMPAASIPTYVEQVFPMSNEVLANNELPAALRLVGIHVTDYVELGGTNSVLDLKHLYTPNDGFADDVPIARDAAGADIVIYISQRGKSVGAAYQLTSGSVASGGMPNYAYGYVRTDGWDVPYVFLHEVGHMLGIGHADQASSTFPGGYAYRSMSPEFYTVNYTGNATPVAPYFSSIARATLDGYALTDGIADSETVLRQTIPVVANYRQSTIPGC